MKRDSKGKLSNDIRTAGQTVVQQAGQQTGQTGWLGEDIEIPEQYCGRTEDGIVKQDTLIASLKESHSKEQNAIVKEIKKMSLESHKMIEDITNIETEIDTYQNSIEDWLKKIGSLATLASKIQTARQTFARKAANITRLKDYLAKDLKTKI